MAVAIGVPLLVYLAQDALIFHRQPLAEGRRAQLARQADVAEVWLGAADGARVHAWHLKSGPTLVLYFGGNAEEVSWMLEAARAEAPGVSWLLLDYRGYGLSEGAPSQQALVAEQAIQCGFCTPGVLLAAHALLAENAAPTEADVRQALAGNLCRCTGYVKIVEAVLAAAKSRA